ncbi:conserved oligomeric Golgi complex subunit 6-like [Bolinopsis microptera]|uniref:conserved oligomeric Golgi complex subunit 6-like n=1 Tax=Bolinopsis microptera TaxID=2820187 RepID=UPI0030791A38
MSPKNDDSTSNPLSRKLQKVLSLKLDQDPDLIVALKGLSSVVTTNNLRTRRNLRGDFERRSVNLSVELCESFSHVNQLVEKLNTEITTMSESCQEMTTELSTARKQMQGLLEKTSKIKRESASVEMKKEVITAFISRYHVTPQQAAVLKRSDQMDPEFFTVLDRVKSIHQDCKILLQTHQTTGLQIMENMAHLQEQAFQTLFKWTQNECRHLTSDIPEPSTSLKQGFLMLQDRESLLKATLSELAKVRRAVLLRMFINSLTRGGPGGTPKPIELSSHDPIRYGGDMLAWLHQTIASERDLLSSFLPTKETVVTVLCEVTEGVSRTLKIRVEQIINNTDDCITLLQICNIIQFYLSTIKPFLSEAAPLITLISELNTQCRKQFNRHYALSVSRLSDRNELPGLDLVPTMAFQEAVHLLKIILNTHDVSVVPDVSPLSSMTELLHVVIGPILTLCNMSASQLDPVDNAVYIINLVACLYNVLAMYENTDNKLELLQNKINEELETLTNLQYDHMIKTTKIPPAEMINKDRLSVVASKLDQALLNTELLWLQQCTRLSALRHRNTVWRGACEQFVKVYTTLIQSTCNEGILLKSPDQIAQLLK